MPEDSSLSLETLANRYAEGTTAAEFVTEVYRRIEAVGDPAIFLHLRPIEDVLADAAALPREDLPLWGIPFVIKDNIDAARMPTTAACPAYAYTPAEDAFVVARLRAAGALLIGKTNLDQFASGLVGVRSPYGVPRNSLDPEIVPGGSSSGSAVAIGHGMVTFALGTDTAGSGRVPAALNGIVGLKPSLGALSARGVVPACRTLDTISIFAGNVSDAFKVFQVACAYDAEDAYSKPITPGALGCVPKGLSIGVPSPATREFLSDVAQSDMFDAAIARFIQAGATISEIDFKPFLAVAELLYQGAWVAERYAVVEDLMQTNRDAIHPITAKIIAAAEGLSAADAFRGIYRLRELSRLAQDAMGGVDLLCVPSIPTFYTLADLQADPVTPNSNLGTYTNFVNLLDMCGITVPTGPRADGRPGSVTLLARSGQDALAASVAQVFEDAFETGPTLVPLDMTVLAVCGAHMSGLPLNRELTSRGATMLKRARTAPCYSLYALAGGPPKRPGLLRRENGVEIDVELWMLPDAELASFVSGIPSPLSLGTVLLRDGEKALGFLVEACGVDGAEDISGYGGWRAYLSDSESRKQPALQRL